VAKPKPEPRECLCGCKGMTGGGQFLPGHDAKYKSHLIKEALAGGNPEAEEILRQRGWTRFLDKAREIAERPAVPRGTPRKSKTEASEGRGSIERLLVLKAAAKVLKATGQYAKASPHRIELTLNDMEGIVTFTHPRLNPPDAIDPEMSVGEWAGWDEAETEAVRTYLRLAHA
jgi:hypothetical protein